MQGEGVISSDHRLTHTQPKCHSYVTRHTSNSNVNTKQTVQLSRQSHYVCTCAYLDHTIAARLRQRYAPWSFQGRALVSGLVNHTPYQEMLGNGRLMYTDNTTEYTRWCVYTLWGEHTLQQTLPMSAVTHTHTLHCVQGSCNSRGRPGRRDQRSPCVFALHGKSLAELFSRSLGRLLSGWQ